MGEFKLDTSGFVLMPRGRHWDGVNWSDLSPFAQGYVEALFAELHKARELEMPNNARLGFLHLSPEALAMILRDCEARRASVYCVGNTREAGRSFWTRRQAGERQGFPPLTPVLSEDGKVNLVVQAQVGGGE